jgi:hypothetical protein
MNKKYFIFTGIIVLPLLLFVFINEQKGNYYRSSVEDTHALLTGMDINISAAEIEAEGTEMLAIDVVTEGEPREGEHHITIPADQLLNGQFLKRLRKHEGTIAIVSEDKGLAALAWVILSRKGFDELKIKDIKENETLQYTFEPKENPAK